MSGYEVECGWSDGVSRVEDEWWSEWMMMSGEDSETVVEWSE